MNADLQKLKEHLEEILPDHPERLGGTPIERAQLGVQIAILEELEKLNANLGKRSS